MTENVYYDFSCIRRYILENPFSSLIKICFFYLRFFFLLYKARKGYSSFHAAGSMTNESLANFLSCFHPKTLKKKFDAKYGLRLQ